MAWTVPRTWTEGADAHITAKRLNVDLRDNMSDLKSFADNPAISFHFDITTGEYQTTTTSRTAITSLSIPGTKALKNTRWTFYSFVTVNGPTAQDLFISINAPTGSVGRFSAALISGTSANNNSLTSTDVSTGELRLQLQGAGSTDLAVISGTIQLGTATGDITLKGRQNSGGTASKLYKGGFISAIRTATATATSS